MSIRPEFGGGRDILEVALETGHLMSLSQQRVFLLKLRDRGECLKRALHSETVYHGHPAWVARDVLFDMAIGYLEGLPEEEN